ncbi:hypothetical protein LCGC14_0410190 [marine sediment metagenome]|uniref:Uncharacterized protein n=1 Tax=marine sediment metagenome TaxID=412755 RepID=A0A0F9SU71_9ZZZZ
MVEKKMIVRQSLRTDGPFIVVRTINTVEIRVGEMVEWRLLQDLIYLRGITVEVVS